MRDVRALARAALCVANPKMPPQIPSRPRRSVARATETLEAARKASTLLEEHEDLARNLGVNVVGDQIHSPAVDLIEGTGTDRAAALRTLQEAAGRASW